MMTFSNDDREPSSGPENHVLAHISRTKGPSALKPWRVPTNVMFVIILKYNIYSQLPS